MPSIAPVLPSGSTNGRQTKVVATATPGTTIHTATSTSGAFDELTLYAVNSDTVSRDLTLELGGTTSPDDTIKVTIPPLVGPVAVLSSHRLNGGVVVRAFASAANVIMIHGDVNRYTP